VLVLAAFPYALANSSRPIVGRGSVLASERTKLYFTNRPELLDPYTNAANYIKRSGARDIGLIVGGDSYEYPLWVLLDDLAAEGHRIEHIDVENSTRKTAVPSTGFDPELVVVVDLEKGDSFTDSYGDYVRVRDLATSGSAPVFLYRKVQ
jgi:hypothetical protein